MKGYTYIHEGKVVVNPKEKPREFMFTTSKFGGVIWDTGKYMEALDEWESKLIEVENACEYEEPEPPLGIVINPDSADYEVIIEGIEVSYKLQGKKAVIISIN